MTRTDGRTADQLRPVTITRRWLEQGEGSVLVEFGLTKVLCQASFTSGVPRWRKGSGQGWVTAEYAMLPRSTNTRGDRESVRGKIGGRTHEISRLVGRSLRAVIDTSALGENTVVLDCDVLQADGGTRTAAITGAYVALADAVAWAKAEKLVKADAVALTGTVAAVSVGVVGGDALLDLCYTEDVTAETDMNIVCTGDGQLRRGAGHRRGRAVRPRAARPPARPRGGRVRRAHPHPAGGAGVVTRVVLASRNAHKIEELARILLDAGLDVELVGVEDFPDVAEVAETGETFEANALLKAVAVAAATGLPAIGDDSGLCVDALNGMPGIFSARWSGGGGDRANLELLLAQLADVPPRATRGALRLRRRGRAARRPYGCRRGPARRRGDPRAAGHQRLRLRPGLRAGRGPCAHHGRAHRRGQGRDQPPRPRPAPAGPRPARPPPLTDPR